MPASIRSCSSPIRTERPDAPRTRRGPSHRRALRTTPADPGHRRILQPGRCWPLVCSGICLAICCLTSLGAVAEILRLDVERDRERFMISFEVALDAPAARVREIMHQPRLWPELSEVILSTTVEPLPGDGHRVSSLFRHCILVFCRSMEKVSDFHVTPEGDLAGRSLPGRGDFLYVREDWRILPDNDGSLVQFDAELVPAFGVPPLIGPMLIRIVLKDILSGMEDRLVGMATADPQ